MIYFVKCKYYIKIGKTINLKNRMISLNLSNPEPLILLGIIKTDSEEEDSRIEKSLHKKFFYLRHKGEWFHDKGSVLTNYIIKHGEKAPITIDYKDHSSNMRKKRKPNKNKIFLEVAKFRKSGDVRRLREESKYETNQYRFLSRLGLFRGEIRQIMTHQTLRSIYRYS